MSLYPEAAAALTQAGGLLTAGPDRIDLACRWAYLCRDELKLARALRCVNFAVSAGRHASRNAEGRALFTRAAVQFEVPQYRDALADLESAEPLLEDDDVMLEALSISRANIAVRGNVRCPGAEEALHKTKDGQNGIFSRWVLALFAWRHSDLATARAELEHAAQRLVDLEFAELAGVAFLDLAALAVDLGDRLGAAAAFRGLSDVASTDAASIRLIAAARCFATFETEGLRRCVEEATFTLRRRWRSSGRQAVSS